MTRIRLKAGSTVFIGALEERDTAAAIKAALPINGRGSR